MDRRRAVLAGGSAVLAAVLADAGRPASFVGVALLVTAVVLLAGGPDPRRPSTGLAVLVAAAPTIVLVGALHDRLPAVPPTWLSVLVIGAIWVAAARTFGTAVAEAVARPQGRVPRDVWMRVTAVGAVTGWFAAALLRHLLPSSSVATRLGWIVGEEDNAHVVGVAREVILAGPRGEELAEQYGTAFVNVPSMFLRLLGGTLRGDDDARLQAITAFTVSTIVVILLAGLALGLLASLPHRIHPGTSTARSGALADIGGTVTSAGVTTIAMALLIVLPMRSGFLTFVWGLTFVLLAAACIAALPATAARGARVTVAAHLIATVLLLLSSWPFILPALGPLLLLPLLWLRWRDVLGTLRSRPAITAGAVAAGLLVVAVGTVSFARWGPAAEVLSYGRDLLVVGGSSIRADQPAWSTAVVALTLATIAIAALTRPHARGSLLLAVVGPVAGAVVLYLGLRVAAQVLTGGALDYAGQKLLYGIVTLALVLGLTALASLAGRLRATASIVLVAALLALHTTSSTASIWTSWWSRTDLGEGAHVIATVDAIRRTNDEVPIRCLPSSSTAVTPAARLAIYYCVRWMEDAFNPGRFQGFRDELRDTGDETFGPIVEQVLTEAQSEYLFAYRFTMGPGWYGWQGPGT